MIGEKPTKLHSNWVSWGDEIEITIIGMWGQDAYSRRYTYSGAKGKYPETIFRFTQIGQASILAEEYSDVEIGSKYFKVGYRFNDNRIDKIIKQKDAK